MAEVHKDMLYRLTLIMLTVGCESHALKFKELQASGELQEQIASVLIQDFVQKAYSSVLQDKRSNYNFLDEMTMIRENFILLKR